MKEIRSSDSIEKVSGKKLSDNSVGTKNIPLACSEEEFAKHIKLLNNSYRNLGAKTFQFTQ